MEPDSETKLTRTKEGGENSEGDIMGVGRRVRMEQEKGWMGGADGNKAREESKKEGTGGECCVLKKRGSQGREGRQEAE